ncbi:Bax inhibitor-1 family protein [Kosakonia sp. BK9b]
MKLFGWLRPAQVAPAQLMTGVCLWLAAAMLLSAAVAWWVLDVMAINAFRTPGPAIAVMIILWFATGGLLSLLFPRGKSVAALCGLTAVSLMTGLLFASLFSLPVLLLLFAVTGGMFAISAVVARLGIRGGGYFFLMLLTGMGLAGLANSLQGSSGWLWTGSVMMVLMFSLVSVNRSRSIADSARGLYARDYTSVQCCALRGALAIYLGVITAFFELARLLVDLLALVGSGSNTSR